MMNMDDESTEQFVVLDFGVAFHERHVVQLGVTLLQS